MRRKNWFGARVAVCVELALPSQVCVGFLQGPWFPVASQRCGREASQSATLSQAEGVCVSRPARKQVPSRVVPPGALRGWGRVHPLESAGWKIVILDVFILFS